MIIISNWFYFMWSNYVASIVIQNLFESNWWCDFGYINVSRIVNKLSYNLDKILINLYDIICKINISGSLN